MKFPTAHALLRDRRDWLGQQRGLALDRDGNLALARVPAAAKAIEVATSYPYAREVSGIAAGSCDALFVSDTANDRVLYVDGLCNAQAWLGGAGPSDLPGSFKSPRGLALTFNALLVADTGNSRLQQFALPRLEAHLALTAWAAPTSVAADSLERILVIDAASGTLHRLGFGYAPDVGFDNAIAGHGVLQAPLFVACGFDDRVLVSDGMANRVFVFNADGDQLDALDGPSGWMPGAIACIGTRVYVADAASGEILVFDDGVLTGALGGWRGPVTGLAVNGGGDLFIKPSLDATYYKFMADAAYVVAGDLLAGPFDAGEERQWERAWLDARVPADTSLEVDVALSATPTPPPAITDWIALPSRDVLLALLAPGERRFIWFRIALATQAPQASPVLMQARAATAAENLLDYLPLTYGQNDGNDGFLARWLSLVRGEFGRVEELLDDMPRVGDPRFASAIVLPWLAQWLALELPQIADDEERRTLLAQAVQLLARRGTPASIAEFVELHTGIRPTIVEAFEHRSIWSLGANSRLGFETQLAPLDPFGMVVPEEDAGDGCCPQDAPGASSDACCLPCAGVAPAAAGVSGEFGAGPVGRAIVGESGPLASYQIGLPLFSEEAYRFCVIVDAYRAHDPAIRAEIARIVDREKPAHTDYRIDFIEPETRVGLQAQIGVDLIVGGDAPPLQLGPAQLGIDTQLPPPDVARIGETTLDGLLNLT